MTTKSKSLKYSLLLVLTAMIWGAAFVAQSAGMDYVGPYTFNSIRSILGSIVLLPVIFVLDKITGVVTPWSNKTLWKAGLVCGVLLFLATTTQQVGIMYTTVGKAGFLTAIYIVLVPVFSILLKKKPYPTTWVAVLLALFGLYFLCIQPGEGFSFKKGEILLLACAALFALQIMSLDKFAPGVDCVKLSIIQFMVCGVLGIPLMLTEHTPLSAICDCWLPIGYAGVFSCGVAYTLQAVSQKEVRPAIASLIMSLESVFSVLFGFLILHETLTIREGIGCVIMFAAVLFAELAPIVFFKEEIVGESKRLYLRRMKKSDTSNIVRWRNSSNVQNNFIYRKPITKKDHYNWIETKVKTGLVEQFIIVEKEKETEIGSIYFRDIDRERKTAEFGIFIGEENALGKGFGYEAQKIILDYAKEKMGMKEITLRVLSHNEAAIHNYEKFGFEQYSMEEIKTEKGTETVIFMRLLLQ